jgi:hypothetical protein
MYGIHIYIWLCVCVQYTLYIYIYYYIYIIIHILPVSCLSPVLQLFHQGLRHLRQASLGGAIGHIAWSATTLDLTATPLLWLLVAWYIMLLFYIALIRVDNC